MNIKKFKECNVIYAEKQDEYKDLPSHKTSDGVVTSCWQFSFFERLKVLFLGKVYLSVLTFNHPLQPLMMVTYNPVKDD